MNQITQSTISELSVVETLPLDQHPAAVYLAGLKERSRRPQKQALETIAGLMTDNRLNVIEFPWHKLRFQHTQAIRSKLINTNFKPATVNRSLSALRGVLRAAWRLELMTSEEYHRAIDVKSVVSSTIPAGRELSSGEISALMGDCENDPTPAGCRDAAIIALMYSCGLRRDEVVNLRLDSIDSEAGRLVVSGKRYKERTAYLVNGAARAMEDWLEIRGRHEGALFMPVNKGGVIQNRCMTNQAIYNILKKRAANAGVKEFSPHDLRRTFVSDLLDAGADISTVAKMAGHANVTTTARYDRRPEEAKKMAAGFLHVPYLGRSRTHQ
jgi:site-specific recombinase XerD